VDADDKREAPQGWRQYLTEIKGTFEVVKWVRDQVLDRRIYPWMKKFLATLVLAIAFQAIQPRLLSMAFDAALGKHSSRLLIGLCGFLFCLVAHEVLVYYQRAAREWVFGINWTMVNNKIATSFFGKSLGQHIQESSLLKPEHIEKGKQRLLDLEGYVLFEGAQIAVTLPIKSVLLWVLSPVAGALMTLNLIVYVIWGIYLNKEVAQVCTPIEKDFRRLHKYTCERLDKSERVITTGKEDEEIRHMSDRSRSVIERDRSFWLWFIKQIGWRETPSMISVCLIYAYGFHLLWTGQWTGGLIYPLLSWTIDIAGNIWKIGDAEHRLYWALPSIKAMIEALSLPPDVVDAPNAVEITRDRPIGIRFENVTHVYPVDTDEYGEKKQAAKERLPVLRNINFEIKPGEVAALIGPSGAGKTTIMRLILRYMDPTEGTVHLNGWRLRDVRRASWMRVLGYIPQYAQIFDGTIRSNLVYGLTPAEGEKMSDDDLWQLMRLLKIDFGERLVNGLDTRVGEDGVKLSGGQAQRLMIGAAAIKKPIFMVIDEATSSLDSSTEKAVQEGLSQVLRDVTALVVAHRLSTVRYLCDKFIVLKNSEDTKPEESQIEAMAGSFEELYAISPTFHQLADDQGIAIETFEAPV